MCFLKLIYMLCSERNKLPTKDIYTKTQGCKLGFSIRCNFFLLITCNNSHQTQPNLTIYAPFFTICLYILEHAVNASVTGLVPKELVFLPISGSLLHGHGKTIFHRLPCLEIAR